MSDLLRVTNLTVQYLHDKTYLSAVKDVSFSLQAGETLGLVGESGCGKSTIGLTLMGLLPIRESRITSGTILFKDRNLLELSKEEIRKVRGKNISIVFQDPFSALNPVMTIEEQLQEIYVLEEGHPNIEKARQLLEEVQLPDFSRILSSYPHQLSGGQRQRVLIACALARRPDLLLADEPTTALDVLVQAEIVQLLKKLQIERRMAMLFVTHNMGLVKNVADRVAVMKDGQIVEIEKTQQLLTKPRHPYTQGLLNCLLTFKPHMGPLPTLDL